VAYVIYNVIQTVARVYSVTYHVTVTM